MSCSGPSGKNANKTPKVPERKMKLERLYWQPLAMI